MIHYIIEYIQNTYCFVIHLKEDRSESVNVDRLQFYHKNSFCVCVLEGFKHDLLA